MQKLNKYLCSARFLFDVTSPEYKWYDQKVLDTRNQLAGKLCYQSVPPLLLLFQLIFC